MSIDAYAAKVPLRLYGAVGADFPAAQTVDTDALVKAIDAARGKPVELRISSPGGLTRSGMEVVSAIQKHGNVTAVIDSEAQSVAAVIAAACKRVVAAQGAVIMVHAAWTGIAGNAQDLRSAADYVEKVTGITASILAARMHKPVAEVIALLNKGETYFTATEALDIGLVDAIQQSGTTPARQVAVLSPVDHKRRMDAYAADLVKVRAAALAAFRSNLKK